jgi:hypothetical protein
MNRCEGDEREPLIKPSFSSRRGVICIVPDKRSRVLEVFVVRRIINLGTGNLEWGGNGKGLRRERSVYE